jgi:hypothetical protein
MRTAVIVESFYSQEINREIIIIIAPWITEDTPSFTDFSRELEKRYNVLKYTGKIFERRWQRTE